MELANTATIPRSEKVLGRANFPAAVTVGQLVRVTIAKIGNFYQVAVADPTSVSGVPAVAVVLEKSDPTTGVIQFHGPVKDVYSGLTPGRTYFVGTDGLPAAPGDANFPPSVGSTYFQQIGFAVDDDELMLQLLSAGALPTPRIYAEELAGAKPGTTFATAFPYASGTEIVYMNGQRLDTPGCYTRVESGGAGTGFDTIETTFTVISSDQLIIDYDPA